MDRNNVSTMSYKTETIYYYDSKTLDCVFYTKYLAFQFSIRCSHMCCVGVSVCVWVGCYVIIGTSSLLMSHAAALLRNVVVLTQSSFIDVIAMWASVWHAWPFRSAHSNTIFWKFTIWKHDFLAVWFHRCFIISDSLMMNCHRNFHHDFVCDKLTWIWLATLPTVDNIFFFYVHRYLSRSMRLVHFLFRCFICRAAMTCLRLSPIYHTHILDTIGLCHSFVRSRSNKMRFQSGTKL